MLIFSLKNIGVAIISVFLEYENGQQCDWAKYFDLLGNISERLSLEVIHLCPFDK
jgi:hypothetical protein